MSDTAIYCRISEDRDATGLGVKRQEADCRELAKRNRWTVGEVYVDNDISAYSGKPRPAFERLVADVSEGLVEVVVAWHPDRLTRRPVELESFIDLVEATGVRIATVTAGDYDLSTATGRMQARVVGAVARHESEQKSERTRRKHLELAERGRPVGGGHRPFGFEEDRVTLRPGEAAKIREAAERVLAGDSICGICAEWTEHGPAPIRGARWWPEVLKHILCAPRTAGLREYHGEVMGDAVWDPILDRVTWERLRRLLLDPARSRKGPPRRYLLSGIVTCGSCGGVMPGHTSRGKPRYACNTGCAMQVLAEPVEELVTTAVSARLDGPGLWAKVNQREANEDVELIAEVDELRSRLEDLAELFGDGEVTRIEWARARQRIVARLDEIGGLLEDSARGVTLRDVNRGLFEGLSAQRRRAVIAAVVDRVVVSSATPGLNRFDPGRVSLEWAV